MTAVEWLTEKLRTEFGFAFSNNILEQAKEMEKQQREIDFKAGNDSACMEHEDIKDYFNKYIKSE